MPRFVAIDINDKTLMVIFKYDENFEDDVVAYARKELGNDIDIADLEKWLF